MNSLFSHQRPSDPTPEATPAEDPGSAASANEAPAAAAVDPELAAWHEALALERWYLPLRGPQEEPRPFVAVFDGDPLACVFTSAEAATQFGVAQGWHHEEAGRLLALPVQDAVRFLHGLEEHGVDAAVLDPGTQGIAISTLALAYLSAARGAQ